MQRLSHNPNTLKRTHNESWQSDMTLASSPPTSLTVLQTQGVCDVNKTTHIWPCRCTHPVMRPACYPKTATHRIIDLSPSFCTSLRAFWGQPWQHSGKSQHTLPAADLSPFKVLPSLGWHGHISLSRPCHHSYHHTSFVTTGTSRSALLITITVTLHIS